MTTLDRRTFLGAAVALDEPLGPCSGQCQTAFRTLAGVSDPLPSTLQALPALRHRVRWEVTEALHLLDDAAFPVALASELQAQYARSLTSILALVDISVTAQQLSWRLRQCQLERNERW